MKPNNGVGGFISGTFPPITIEEGDRFTSTVGCMDQNGGCSVLFQLQAELPGGARRLLSEWPETYDEVASDFSVDLSDLAGEEVSLVLVVMENGGRSLEAKAYWLNPVLERAAR
jgi:hypothetical protein